MRIWIIFLVLLACVPVLAVTNNITCDYVSISNACATASDGDVIQIGVGDCYMTNTIIINRSVSFELRGVSTNLTTLRSPNGQQQMFAVYSDSTKLFSIDNLNLVGNTGNTYFVQFGGVNGACPGQYHIWSLQMTNIFGRGLSVGYGNAFGCIDHCTFVAAPSGYLQCVDFNGGYYSSWTNSVNPLGTTNVCCVEYCYLQSTTNIDSGNGFFDSYNGAQVLFRYNYLVGDSPIGGHGYDSIDSSIRTWEIYGNTNINTLSLVFSVWRGGTGVVFSNTITGPAGTLLLTGLGYYRANPQVNNTYNSVFDGITNYWLKTGVPGTTYTVNFTGYTNFPAGQYFTLTNNANDGDNVTIGFTHYFFITNITEATFNMINNNGFGGGPVLIGIDTAHTITNFLNAINVVAAAFGTSYTNWGGVPYLYGHDYIATGCDKTNLYLTNKIDGNLNQFGYPANQQESVLTSWPLTGTNFQNPQTVWCIYAWGNTYNGAAVGITVASTPSATVNITNLMIPGQNYSNAVAPLSVYSPLVNPHPLDIINSVATFTLTVNSGTGGGSYASNSVVSISANSVPGQGFSQWTGNTSFLASPLSASTTATVTTNITVTATYTNTPSGGIFTGVLTWPH